MYKVCAATKSYLAGMMLLSVVISAQAANPDSAVGMNYEWPACGRVDSWPGEAWQEASPTGGWDAGKLAEARAYFERAGSASMMVVWRGHPIAAWGEVDEPYLVQSVRKPIINAIAGQLVDAGALDLSATLADLGIQDHDPPLSPLNLSATVADIFRSRSGIYHSAHYEVGGWKRARAELAAIALQESGEPSFPPGRVWVYNNWDFNAAGEIVARAGGAPLERLIEERLARPLQMQDFDEDNVSYEEDGDLTAWMIDNHSAIPAYLIEISARDLARVGLLNLGCGEWNGRRILSEAWVRESITGIPVKEGAPKAFDWQNSWDSYGYLWFVEASEDRGAWTLDHLPPYYGHGGNRGHLLLVMPYLDLVIAHEVATTGGSGLYGQVKRSIFGSPDVGDGTIEKLIAMTIAAHPDPVARAATEAALEEFREYEMSTAVSQP